MKASIYRLRRVRFNDTHHNKLSDIRYRLSGWTHVAKVEANTLSRRNSRWAPGTQLRSRRGGLVGPQNTLPVQPSRCVEHSKPRSSVSWSVRRKEKWRVKGNVFTRLHCLSISACH